MLTVVGAGYLGRRLVPHLASYAPLACTTTSREKVKELEKIFSHVSFLKRPLDLLESLQRYMVVCVAPCQGRDYEQTYVSVAQTLHQSPPDVIEHLVYISSTSVYGNHQGKRVTEKSSLHPKHDKHRHLIQAEQLIASMACRTTILRASMIVGPNRLLSKALRPLLMGTGQEVLNLVHVEDLARAVAFSLTKGLEGIFNVSYPKALTRQELCQQIGVEATFTQEPIDAKIVDSTLLIQKGFTYENSPTCGLLALSE